MKRRYVVLILLSTMLAACQAGARESLPSGPTPDPTAEMESIQLPEPTGPYAIGHIRFDVVDATREEIHTTDPGDQRELLAEIWYPADPSPDFEPALYMAAPLAEAWDIDPVADQSLAHSYENPPPVPGSDSIPVLVFNGGFTGLPTAYTVLMEEFASHGYLVATISHPYADAVALLADGTVVAYPGDAAFLTGLSPSDPYGAETYLNWIPDTIALLRELDRLNDEMFGGRLAMDRIGYIGHSFGGGTSAEICRILADSCAAAINLDGSHPQRLQMLGMPVPYLYLAAGENRVEGSQEIQRMISATRAPMTVVEIAGATHFGFGDGFYLWQVKGQPEDVPADHYGTIDPLVMTKIVRAFSLAFFDQHVRGLADTPSLDSLAAEHPEVTVQVYSPED